MTTNAQLIAQLTAAVVTMSESIIALNAKVDSMAAASVTVKPAKDTAKPVKPAKPAKPAKRTLFIKRANSKGDTMLYWAVPDTFNRKDDAFRAALHSVLGTGNASYVWQDESGAYHSFKSCPTIWHDAKTGTASLRIGREYDTAALLDVATRAAALLDCKAIEYLKPVSLAA